MDEKRCNLSLYVLNTIDMIQGGWGARLSKRFCDMFFKSSPCLLGQHGSCSSAKLLVGLSENMLLNLLLDLLPQTVDKLPTPRESR